MPRKNRQAASVNEQLRAMVAAGTEGFVGKYAMLAARLDVAEDLVRDAVAVLSQQGHIRVTSAGRAGVRLMATGTVPPTEAQTPRATPIRVALCPWCQATLAPDWRYCAECGKGLPRTR